MSFDVSEVDSLFSDGHSIISLTLKISEHPTKIIKNKATNECSINTKPPKWQESLSSQFVENINKTTLSSIENSLHCNPQNVTKLEINEIAKNISNLFVDSAFATFKNKTNKKNHLKQPNNKPWYGPSCSKARRLYHIARKKYNRSKCDLNKHLLNKASKHYKCTINSFVRKHKFMNERKLRDKHLKQPKDYWRILKNFNKDTHDKMPDIQDLYDHFRKINYDESHNEDSFINPDQSAQYDTECLNCPITTVEINKVINKCKNSKASSPQDNIINEYIKCTKHLMLPIYCLFFNMIFNSGIIPDTWLIGTIKPIYKKKGSPLNPENFRPITILSCLGKIFTAILNERMSTFLERNNILKENQAGFRANYSTTDHIFTLKFLIDVLKSQKKKLFCAFIDFSLAFDKIWRTGLWGKLIKNGIDGKFYNIILNMYSGIKSCISVNDISSPFFKSNCGVRQGENLSPALFSIYLNDLESHLGLTNDGIIIERQNIQADLYLKLFVLLYADDTIIVSDSPESLQKLLNDFYEYCSKWKLTINKSKTKIIIFGSNKPGNFRFLLNNEPIEIIKEYKYLGVLFSSSGSFLNARKYLVNQANKAMHILYSKIFNLDIPIDLQLKLFDQTIVPILTFNCEVWGFENLDLIETVQNNFLRTITKSKKSTPLYMLYGELGRYPMDIVIKSRMVNYWCKLVMGNRNKISKVCYDIMLNSDTSFKWSECIKQILNNTGNTYIWENQMNINLKNFSMTIKRTLIDQFLQNWNSSLTGSSKGLTYQSFKSDNNFEQYLIALPNYLRMTFFHLRTGNHRLPIETGRWRQSFVPHAERKCQHCQLNDLGDEFHYILKCPFFLASRKRYIKPYFFNRPNMLKFSQLMSSKSTKELKNIALFSREIMTTFKR